MGVISSFIARTRQNHALEHATVHLLTRSNPSLRLVGRSDWRGLSLYGGVDTQEVLRAAIEGLARLKRGEGWLAMHPRCGTNIAVAALLGGGTAYTAITIPGRSRFQRAIGVILALVSALVVAQPLGMRVQRHLTTTTDMRGVRLRAIRRQLKGNLVVHRLVTSWDS